MNPLNCRRVVVQGDEWR